MHASALLSTLMPLMTCATTKNATPQTYTLDTLYTDRRMGLKNGPNTVIMRAHSNSLHSALQESHLKAGVN